jgi:hypothetical protein
MQNVDLKNENTALSKGAVSGSAFRQLKSFCCGPTRFKIEEAINERPIDVVSITGDGNVYIVFYYEKQFFNFKETKPPIGVEVMSHSKSWIDEDYNKKGIRVGFLNEDENGDFISAQWDNSGDTYENCEEEKPEVWWYF